MDEPFRPDPAPEIPLAERAWFAWALVILGLGLLYLIPMPPLVQHLAQCGRGLTAGNLAVLFYLLGIAALPIAGFWRLSRDLGLTPWLALLYLFFPLLTLGIYVGRSLMDAVLPDY